MNLLKYSIIFLLTQLAVITHSNAEHFTPLQLEKAFEKVSGMTAEDAKKGEDGKKATTIVFLEYTCKDKAFPRIRLQEELKANLDLFNEVGMNNLPKLMKIFANKKDLTDIELLLAVRISRVTNGQIPANINPKKRHNKSQ